LRTPINLERLNSEMFRRGLDRRDLAGLAGISERTLAGVFAEGLATQKTKLKLSIALQKKGVVLVDPDLLEKSA
jgi:AraC-like DNA-binding protein